MTSIKNLPLVSVIIPTYNSAKTLPITLASIARQNYPNIEVIVIDRYSTDGTVEIASAFGARVVQKNTERAMAKNIGLLLATGKYVLFLDSDMELTSTVIHECVTLAEKDPLIGAIVIPETTSGLTLLAKIRRYERQFYHNTYIESPRFYRREVALKAGGFDPIVFYEEATLAYKLEKLGFKKGRISSYIIHHEEHMTMTELIRKRYYYGRTSHIYTTRYRDYARFQLNPAYRLRLFFKRKFWEHPHMALAVLALKGLEYLVTKLATLSRTT